MGVAVVAVVALALLSSINCVVAKEYVVGEGECFKDEWFVGCDYDSWAAKYTFALDDVLVFKFETDSRSNSVASVSKMDYDVCTSSGAVMMDDLSGEIHRTSPIKFALSSATSYFISVDNFGFCHQNMSIKIDDGSSSTKTTTTTTSKVEPSPSSSSSSSSKSIQSSSSENNGKSTVSAVVGLLVSYALLLGVVSFVVYCVVHGRRQQQLLLQLQAHIPLQNETSPVLFADGQNNVEVDEQGEYVHNDQPPPNNYVPTFNYQRHEHAAAQLGQIG